MRYPLKYCEVEKQPWGVTTYFPDGCESSIWPQDDEVYSWVVNSLDFKDRVQYALQHDLMHNVVAEVCFDAPSYVVWNSAHSLDIDPRASAAEERLVYYLQRYVAGKIPCVDVQWLSVSEAFRRALFVLNGTTHVHDPL